MSCYYLPTFPTIKHRLRIVHEDIWEHLLDFHILRLINVWRNWDMWNKDLSNKKISLTAGEYKGLHLQWSEEDSKEWKETRKAAPNYILQGWKNTVSLFQWFLSAYLWAAAMNLSELSFYQAALVAKDISSYKRKT